MHNRDDFYKTKMLLEVEVEHQFNPEQGIRLVTDRLSVPAITSVKVICAESNYRLHDKPSEIMHGLQMQLPPVVGEDVYVGSAWYIGHGEDDFAGGLCRITGVKTDVSGGQPTPFVTVKERPGYWYNWPILQESQAQWLEEYGARRGRQDPDYGEFLPVP